MSMRSCRRPHHPSGMTLMEQVVSTSLLAVVMLLTWQVLSPCLKVWQTDQAEVAIDQLGMLDSVRLRAELSRSTSRSLAFLDGDPPALCFLSCDDPSQTAAYDPVTGRPIWRKWVVYFLDVENEILYRKEWPNSTLSGQIPDLGVTLPTTTPTALTPALLRSLCVTTNGTEHRVSHNVQQFSVSQPALASPSPSIRTTVDNRSSFSLSALASPSPSPSTLVRVQLVLGQETGTGAVTSTRTLDVQMGN